MIEAIELIYMRSSICPIHNVFPLKNNRNLYDSEALEAPLVHYLHFLKRENQYVVTMNYAAKMLQGFYF